MERCNMLKLVTILVGFIASVSTLEDRFGSTTYAVKTPNSMSHNETEWEIIINSTKGSDYAPSICRPISVDVMNRHGIRNPGDDDIIVILDLASRLKGKVRNPDFAALNDWMPPFDLANESQLIEEGRRELYGLGSRMAKRYAFYFEGISLDDLAYQATNKQRTIDSGLSFQAGFSASLGTNLTGPLVNRDDILRFYDTCNKYIEEVEENEEALKEVDNYYKSARLQQIAQDVTTRLDLDGIALTSDEVEVIYTVITAEVAVTGSSPWSEVFTVEELALLEYGADLVNYWVESYAYPISYEQVCGLLTSFFDQMADAKEQESIGNSYKRGVFRFAHSQAIMGSSTLLGIFKPDTPLRSDNYEELLETRRYRSGTIVPMAANVGFILYRCNPQGEVGTPPLGVSWPENVDEYMVQLLLNELPIRFPSCDYDLCPYDQVVKAYDDYIGCNTDEVCAVDSNKSKYPISGVAKGGDHLILPSTLCYQLWMVVLAPLCWPLYVTNCGWLIN